MEGGTAVTLPLGIRLEANALIDRLVADGTETFDPPRHPGCWT